MSDDKNKIPDLDINGDGKITYADMKNGDVREIVTSALYNSGIGVGEINFQEARLKNDSTVTPEKYNEVLSGLLEKFSERAAPFIKGEMEKTGQNRQEMYDELMLEYNLEYADIVALQTNLEGQEAGTDTNKTPLDIPDDGKSEEDVIKR